MPPPIWLQKKVSAAAKTPAIRIKDGNDILLQYHPFPLGHERVKGKKRGLTALTAHIFAA
jgi:hypothetical protein